MFSFRTLPLVSTQLALDSAVRADPALADLAAMGAGVSTDGMLQEFRLVSTPG